MAWLAAIRRHPVKGIGAEAPEAARLAPEAGMAGDRALALLTAAGDDGDDWQPRRNFVQVASGPALAPVTAETDGAAVILRHPDRPDLRLTPEDGAALAAWVAPLWPADRPAPVRLVRAGGHGMTDMPEPYVSIGSLASLRALSQRAGRPLDPARFRINLWVEGWAPWEEGDMIGRRLTVGAVPLQIAEPIGRCRATEASPETGRRDTDTLRLLREATDSTDFGVYARVLAPGEVRLEDAVT
jgi:hypothetical protein